MAVKFQRQRRQNLVTLGEAGLTLVRGREIGFVFQEPMTALNPVMRIGSQVGEAVRAHDPNLSHAETERLALAALDLARLPEPARRARQFPHQLSGGLRQRAMIAMALAAGPRLLVADEPTTALDVTVQKEILELLARLRKELGLSLLFITHDLAVVAQVADRLAVMYAGRIVEIGPTDGITASPATSLHRSAVARFPAARPRRVCSDSRQRAGARCAARGLRVCAAMRIERAGVCGSRSRAARRGARSCGAVCSDCRRAGNGIVTSFGEVSSLPIFWRPK